MAAKSITQLKTNVKNGAYGQGQVNATLDFLDSVNSLVTGVPASATLTAAAGGTNIADVTITLLDNEGNALTKPAAILVWLSDAATGVGLTATSASGTVTAKAASGADMGAITAKKVLMAQTKADGTFVLAITDTAKTTFYVACQLPGGQVFVSSQLATESYG